MPGVLLLVRRVDNDLIVGMDEAEAQTVYMRGDTVCVWPDTKLGNFKRDARMWEKHYLVHLPTVEFARALYLREEEEGEVQWHPHRNPGGPLVPVKPLIRLRKVQFDISSLKDGMTEREKADFEAVNSDEVAITEAKLNTEGVTRDRFRTQAMLDAAR